MTRARLLRSRSYRLVPAAACWLVLAMLSGVAFALRSQPAAAQSTDADFRAPALEVVSVRPESEVHFDLDNWGVTADGLSVNGQLSFLIRSAFGAELFEPKQIVGEPAWCDKEAFDIRGKVSSSDVTSLRNLNPQQRTQMGEAMLQAVLADRFKMKAHQESREESIFALVVAKGGPKLKKATTGDPYSNGLKSPSGRATGAGTLIMSRDRLTAQALSLEDLARVLSGPATGRVVLDRTGLTGKYDFTLTWTPDLPASQGDADHGGSADIPGPAIFTAIQEQLGLKLQPAKGPVKILVIDHIERPSEN